MHYRLARRDGSALFKGALTKWGSIRLFMPGEKPGSYKHRDVADGMTWIPAFAGMMRMAVVWAIPVNC